MNRKLMPLMFAAVTVFASSAVLALGGKDANDLSTVTIPGVDKDGDGCLSKAELTPGGQLDKRFSTRDVNGDGKLCKDEYYTPS